MRAGLDEQPTIAEWGGYARWMEKAVAHRYGVRVDSEKRERRSQIKRGKPKRKVKTDSTE